MRIVVPGILLLALACGSPGTHETPRATAPSDYFAALDEAGSVEIRPDPGLVRAGDTTFVLGWKQTFSHQYSWERRSGVTVVRIRPRIDVTVDLRHVIRMPPGREAEGWYGRLLAHEYDHVAVSLDERPRLLFRYIVAAEDEIVAEVPGAPAVDADLVGKLINDRLSEIGQAITKLIQQHYHRLDVVTRCGLVDLPDREGFFRNQYSYEKLVAFGFPFAEKVREFTGSPEYRGARLWYRW